MTELNHRQKATLDLAKSEGFVLVERLAEEFHVTVQTIRRDLNLLCGGHLLQRIHGGAIICDSVANLGYRARKTLAAEGKTRVAKKASELIPNDCTLFINIGTTTEQVAAQLVQHEGLLAITNNLNVLNTLIQSDQIEVITAGGFVRHRDGGIVGDATVDFVGQFRVDYAVIGASSIEHHGSTLR